MATRIDPFREMDRVFSNALGQMMSPGRSNAMPIDLYRDGDVFVLDMDLPGVDPSSIDVDVEDLGLDDIATVVVFKGFFTRTVPVEIGEVDHAVHIAAAGGGHHMVTDVRAQHVFADTAEGTLDGLHLFQDVDAVNRRIFKHADHAVQVTPRAAQPQTRVTARFLIQVQMRMLCHRHGQAAASSAL